MLIFFYRGPPRIGGIPPAPAMQAQQQQAAPVNNTGIQPRPKPKMKMKGLFWNKLNERQQTFYTTIWYTLHQKADNTVQVKFDKLYELFEDIKKKKVVQKVEEPKDDKVALIADDKRTQQIYLSVKKLT